MLNGPFGEDLEILKNKIKISTVCVDLFFQILKYSWQSKLTELNSIDGWSLPAQPNLTVSKQILTNFSENSR